MQPYLTILNKIIGGWFQTTEIFKQLRLIQIPNLDLKRNRMYTLLTL